MTTQTTDKVVLGAVAKAKKTFKKSCTIIRNRDAENLKTLSENYSSDDLGRAAYSCGQARNNAEFAKAMNVAIEKYNLALQNIRESINSSDPAWLAELIPSNTQLL